MSNPFTQLGVADYNQKFVDALEFLDEVIQNRQHMKLSVWRNMVPRGPYALGEGLVKKAFRFHPGLGDQRGLQRWRPIQISRVAEGTDPGVDACSYNPYEVDYGFETINYQGLQTERRTKHICIRDIRFTWEFQQQLALIFGFLGDITNSVWENYFREQYIKFAVDSGNGFVLGQGAPNSINFTYDPFDTDTDGDNTLTIPTGTTVSTLDWTYFQWFSRYLQWQAPQSAIGQENGRPMFGNVFDLEDWDRMLERDAALREDFRFASPMVNIDNFGTVQGYKGFTLMHDDGAPRFAVKSNDGTTITLRRVDPLLEDEPVTLGNKVNVNPDWLNAEFALGTIFLKDVYKAEIPPAGPASPGGGTSFGATPSMNGEFEWLNIQDGEKNLLRENGFYFSRYEAFAKPLAYDDEAIVYLYRRCPHVRVAECNIGEDSQAAIGATVDFAAEPVAGDLDSTNNTITLTLETPLGCEPPQGITLTKDAVAGGGTIAGVIADASAAPTYIFALVSDPGTNTDYTPGDSGGVTCS